MPNLESRTTSNIAAISFAGLQYQGELKTFACTNSGSDISALYNYKNNLTIIDISGNVVTDFNLIFANSPLAEEIHAIFKKKSSVIKMQYGNCPRFQYLFDCCHGYPIYNVHRILGSVRIYSPAEIVYA